MYPYVCTSACIASENQAYFNLVFGSGAGSNAGGGGDVLVYNDDDDANIVTNLPTVPGTSAKSGAVTKKVQRAACS